MCRELYHSLFAENFCSARKKNFGKNFFFGKKLFFGKNIFFAKFFFWQNFCFGSYDKVLDTFTLHSRSKHIPDRFKTDSKNFGNFFGSKYFWTQNVLVSNILGPKFLLDLSYDSKNIHVQNTFRTDSKQIQKNFENFSDQNIFGHKFFFGPKYFWIQISFRPRL